MALVTVFHTFNPAEAQLVRSRLEAANIPALVAHELSSLSMEGYSMSTGGILVQVTEENATDARGLLAATDGPGAETPAAA